MTSRPRGVSGVPLYPKALKKRLVGITQHQGTTFAFLSDSKGEPEEHVIDVKSSGWVNSDNVKRWQIEMSRHVDGQMLAQKTVAQVCKTGLVKGTPSSRNPRMIEMYIRTRPPICNKCRMFKLCLKSVFI